MNVTRDNRKAVVVSAVIFIMAAITLADHALAAAPPSLVGKTGESIAARHPADAGIATDPDVIFSDDFESWSGDGREKPTNKWHDIRKNSTSVTRAIPGKVDAAGALGPGGRVLEIACWSEEGKSQVGGLSLKLGNYNHAGEGLGNGYDEIY